MVRVLFLTNWFNVSHLFAHSSIWPIDRTLSDATTPDQIESGRNRNEGVHHIPQSSRSWVSPSDTAYCHIQGSRGRRSYPTVKMQSAYYTAPTDWAVAFLTITLHLPSFFCQNCWLPNLVTEPVRRRYLSKCLVIRQ